MQAGGPPQWALGGKSPFSGQSPCQKEKAALEGCDVARCTASGRCWGAEAKGRAARLEGGGKRARKVVAAPKAMTWRESCFWPEVLAAGGQESAAAPSLGEEIGAVASRRRTLPRDHSFLPKRGWHEAAPPRPLSPAEKWVGLSACPRQLCRSSIRVPGLVPAPADVTSPRGRQAKGAREGRERHFDEGKDGIGQNGECAHRAPVPTSRDIAQGHQQEPALLPGRLQPVLG